MTVITARKGKVRSTEGRLEDSDALGLTMNSRIISPRYVANGNGAWEGTVSEMLDYCQGQPTWSVEENLIDRGVITVDEDGNQDLEISDVVHLLTYDDISRLLDDPNVTIDSDDSAEDAEVEAWEMTHAPSVFGGR
ncbi:MAG: hypothetical protein KDB26_08565 [Microthrixaceae bacterium]|nr:hypothetical protein [Microthrixaceae bacterium]